MATEHRRIAFELKTVIEKVAHDSKIECFDFFGVAPSPRLAARLHRGQHSIARSGIFPGCMTLCSIGLFGAESSVYLGTADGKVLVYHISERPTGNDSKMEAGCEHQLTIKAKKPVEQIKVSEDLGQVLVLCDGTVTVHDMSTLDPHPKTPALHDKQVNRFCLNNDGPMKKICVATKKKIVLYEYMSGYNQVGEVPIFHTVHAMEWYGLQLARAHHATRRMQTCGPQLATCNMRPATCRVQLGMQRATRNRQHAPDNAQRTTCHAQHTARDNKQQCALTRTRRGAARGQVREQPDPWVPQRVQRGDDGQERPQARAAGGPTAAVATHGTTSRDTVRHAAQPYPKRRGIPCDAVSHAT